LLMLLILVSSLPPLSTKTKNKRGQSSRIQFFTIASFTTANKQKQHKFSTEEG